MFANLGNFWIKTCDLDIIERENWQSYFREGGWQEFKHASGKVGMRFEHIATEKAYEECQMWFARCHEEVYEHFAQLVARR
jgi:hypothetical protein